MINVLGEKLNESGFYDDVLIYNDIIRTDSLYNEQIPLNKTTIDTIFEVSGSEWILSLDKLNYHTILTDKNITQMFSPFISLHIIVEADFSIFEYGNYIPLQSLKIKDTINWETSHVMLENAINELADFNTCLYDAIYISAENGIKKWIPQIKTVERFVVKSNNSAMIEAYDFFICKEYENAVIMWEHVYETIPNNKLKQQAAYNIAIVNEKEMKFENALHWIELAKKINPEVAEIATVSLDNYEKYIKEGIRRMQKYKSIK